MVYETRSRRPKDQAARSRSASPRWAPEHYRLRAPPYPCNDEIRGRSISPSERVARTQARGSPGQVSRTPPALGSPFQAVQRAVASIWGNITSTERRDENWNNNERSEHGQVRSSAPPVIVHSYVQQRPNRYPVTPEHQIYEYHDSPHRRIPTPRPSPAGSPDCEPSSPPQGKGKTRAESLLSDEQSLHTDYASYPNRTPPRPGFQHMDEHPIVDLEHDPGKVIPTVEAGRDPLVAIQDVVAQFEPAIKGLRGRLSDAEYQSMLQQSVIADWYRMLNPKSVDDGEHVNWMALAIDVEAAIKDSVSMNKGYEQQIQRQADTIQAQQHRIIEFERQEPKDPKYIGNGEYDLRLSELASRQEEDIRHLRSEVESKSDQIKRLQEENAILQNLKGSLYQKVEEEREKCRAERYRKYGLQCKLNQQEDIANPSRYIKEMAEARYRHDAIQKEKEKREAKGLPPFPERRRSSLLGDVPSVADDVEEEMAARRERKIEIPTDKRRRLEFEKRLPSPGAVQKPGERGSSASRKRHADSMVAGYRSKRLSRAGTPMNIPPDSKGKRYELGMAERGTPIVAPYGPNSARVMIYESLPGSQVQTLESGVTQQPQAEVAQSPQLIAKAKSESWGQQSPRPPNRRGRPKGSTAAVPTCQRMERACKIGVEYNSKKSLE